MMLLLLLVLPVAAAFNSTSELPEVAFEQFIAQYNKTYASLEEHAYRFSVFTTNLEQIVADNMDEEEEVFGITKFTDLTPEEFKAQYLGYRPQNATASLETPVYSAPASFVAGGEVDWRKKGAVTPVKDQGQCGSCWAYSATEEIESEWFLAGHSLTEFSPQQIISCDKKDDGCNGGDTITAYQYVEKAGGMAKESAYKDTSAKSGNTGKCKKHFATAGGKPSAFSYATKPCNFGKCNKQDLASLAKNVAAKAPASICVNAGKWQNYKRGTLSVKKCGSHASSALDHCVQLVGYSQSGGYYIVRNSWNTDWGIDGYIHLQYGENTCGLANEATFVSFA